MDEPASTVTAGPMLDEGLLGERARETSDAYAHTYVRRSVKAADGAAFTSAEQNALAAYFVRERAAANGRDRAIGEALGHLDRLTKPVLEDEPSHSVGSDIAGLTWAEAYGTLPLTTPPLPQLQWVLESGSAPRVISGVYGSAWRALFCVAALPLVTHTHRKQAGQQATRWTEYLRPKIVSLAATPEVDNVAKVSQTARIAYVTGSLGQAIGDREILEASRTLYRAIGTDRDAQGCPMFEDLRLPTAHCAQLALAADVFGDDKRRDAVLTFLLTHRLHAESELLCAENDRHGRTELSPWAPLALVMAYTNKRAPATAATTSSDRSRRTLRGMLGRARQ